MENKKLYNTSNRSSILKFNPTIIQNNLAEIKKKFRC